MGGSNLSGDRYSRTDSGHAGSSSPLSISPLRDIYIDGISLAHAYVGSGSGRKADADEGKIHTRKEQSLEASIQYVTAPCSYAYLTTLPFTFTFRLPAPVPLSAPCASSNQRLLQERNCCYLFFFRKLAPVASACGFRM